MRIKLGTFKVTSGKLHITDPCYNVGTWCGNYNIPAVNGEWEACINVNKDEAVTSLFAKSKNIPDNIKYVDLDNEVGVDSGQAGVFDPSIYQEHGEADIDDTFYGKCCRETCESFDHRPEKKEQYHGGIVDNAGAVSSSGYGDGGYVAMGAFNGSELVAVKIKFT